MNDLFKILAVRISDRCAPHIRKILKTETTYFFYNEYECDSDPKLIKRKKDADKKEIPADFFQLNPDQPLNISLSAIVGKNGDGKSSLVEVAIRILSNFSYATGFLQDHSELVPVMNVWAVLYYSINNKICSIECQNNIIIFRSDKFKETFDIHNPNRDVSLIEQYEDYLFYTNVSNYSLYAYNSLELSHEYWQEACWIDGIFHKNDGYQTPIVLNPWRENGKININTENHLTKQRLMSLFVDDEPENSFRQISEKQYARYFIFKIEDESKLFSITLRRYFQENSSKNLLTIITNDLNRYYQLKQHPAGETMQVHIEFWIQIQEAVKNYEPLFKKALEIVKNIKSEPGHQGQTNNDEPTDLNNYINALSRFNFNDGKISSILDEFIDAGYQSFNYLQLQRILLIIEIIELWYGKDKDAFAGLRFMSNNINFDNIYIKANLYAIYKTISIFEKYTNQFNDVIPQSDNHFYMFEDRSIKDKRSRLIEDNFKTLIDDIVNKKSHVTLKLRQTLNYIRYNRKYHYIDLEKDKNNKFDRDNGRYGYCLDFTHYRRRLDFIQKSRLKLTTIELLPPPIFGVEIIIEQDGNLFPITLLSSGERQRLNSIGSIIYHLTNINSIASRKNIIKYQYVNLILEEVELYFHPEYQQTYIRYLLERLSKAALSNLKGVNICFITHSPFVLSDIPKNNVLFLSDGKLVRTMQEDTFGANIHTLLQNGFFLNSVPIGDFAKQKINEIFAHLHNGEITLDMRKKILLVSEPFLKSQLLKLYNEISPSTEQQLIEELYQEINKLKSQVYNDKDRK